MIAAKHHAVVIPTHKLPSLEGLTAAKATATLAADHFSVRVSGHEYNVLAPVGWIVSQTPKPGTTLKQGSTISVVTSSGPPPVSVPDVGTITAGGCPAVKATLRGGPPRDYLHVGDVYHASRPEELSATSRPRLPSGDRTSRWSSRRGSLKWSFPTWPGCPRARSTAALAKAHLAVGLRHAPVLGHGACR